MQVGGELGQIFGGQNQMGAADSGVLLPKQIYSNQATVVMLSSNSSQNTSPASNLAKPTTHTRGKALQWTASLLSVLYLCSYETAAKKYLQ